MDESHTLRVRNSDVSTIEESVTRLPGNVDGEDFGLVSMKEHIVTQQMRRSGY
jgi:hypothetical protein